MARPKAPVRTSGGDIPPITEAALTAAAQAFARSPLGQRPASFASSAAIYKKHSKPDQKTDRGEIAKRWQIEAYRQVKICGEARYAATQFASMAGRAEIGISEPQTLATRASWIKDGPEVDALAELVPTVRERSKLIRDFMINWVIAGECYLIARPRVRNDPGYIEPPRKSDGTEYATYEDYLIDARVAYDPLDPDADLPVNPNVENPLWEIVAVTELRKQGTKWSVRHDNNTYIELTDDDPCIRMWNPDPEDRREAWSPFRSMLGTLREIEWLTAHIFRQVRSRLMSAGVWFLPENMTFPPPPVEAVDGGEETIALMNEAELFMASLAASGMYELDMDDVSFPSIVMADAAALAGIDQNKLIKFWSDIDDKAMTLRSSAIRRFALGFDMVPEKVLGASGVAVDGAGGSAGSVNHWGVWANEEQTIANDIEPALDSFVGTLTEAYLRSVVEGTMLVIAYATATLRLRQDRSKESVELYDRGELAGAVMLRENGFDPETDAMKPDEFTRWVLKRLVGGSPSPEQMTEAVNLLGILFKPPVSGNPGAEDTGGGQPGQSKPPSLEDHPYEGPPREQHDHSPAPFTAFHASCEGLVLRALEKAGNRLLNDGKRGRDRDRTTPPIQAHLTASIARTVIASEFDFSIASVALSDVSKTEQAKILRKLGVFCASLYNKHTEYTREALMDTLGGVS